MSERGLERAAAQRPEVEPEVSPLVERQVEAIVEQALGTEPAPTPARLAAEHRQRRRVVVTGIGAITPIGLTAEDFWLSCLEGRSGVTTISQFDASAYPTRVAGEVNDFEPTRYIEAKEARRMSRPTQFAVAAAQEALAQASLPLDRLDPGRIGVLIGTGIGAFTDTERETRKLFERGGMKMSPFYLTMMLPNMSAGTISRLFGLKGYSSTVVTACAAGNQAIGEAVEVIRRGAADVMVAGGTEASICELGLASFCVMRVMTSQNEPPERASRPFDATRDGFVPAEGAGILILEELEHARRRGALILAEVLGYGASSDAYHVTAPDPEGAGAARAMRMALTDAGLEPTRIDYINAHGTSTELNDKTETLAIKRVLGEHAYRIPVSSTKSMIGHLLGAAGAVEAIATILALRDQQVHPTINLEHPDPDCDLDYVPEGARRTRVDIALSNSFGFGGQNAVLIFGRWRGDADEPAPADERAS